MDMIEETLMDMRVVTGRPAHSKATLGDRSYSLASSSVWNSIPNGPLST